VTVGVCANMSGKEKMKLLVIGRSKQLKCIKRVKSLEVFYDFNKKACMTCDVFNKLFVRFDNKMCVEKRKWFYF